MYLFIITNLFEIFDGSEMQSSQLCKIESILYNNNVLSITPSIITALVCLNNVHIILSVHTVIPIETRTKIRNSIGSINRSIQTYS